MGSRSRNKGAAGERELIHAIEEWTGIRLERNLAQSFGGGHDLIGLDHWAIECKRYAEITDADKYIILASDGVWEVRPRH